MLKRWEKIPKEKAFTNFWLQQVFFFTKKAECSNCFYSFFAHSFCPQTWKKISCVFFGICITPESPSSPDTHTQGLTVAIAMLSFFIGIITTRYGIPREEEKINDTVKQVFFSWPSKTFQPFSQNSAVKLVYCVHNADLWIYDFGKKER